MADMNEQYFDFAIKYEGGESSKKKKDIEERNEGGGYEEIQDQANEEQ